MNYAIFGEWVRDRVEELVGFGVSRSEAESLMHSLEMGAIANEAENRRDEQFILDFKRHGSTEMGRRYRCSAQAMRKRFTKLVNRNARLRTELREEA